MIEGMPSGAFARNIARNIRAARVRNELEQRNVVARMRAMGFGNWHRQTLSKIETGERRLLADELLALAYALDTSIEMLVTPAADAKGYIQFGEGAVHVQHAAARVRGVNDRAIQWDGDKPLFMVNLAGFGEEAERLGASPDAEDEAAEPAGETG
jgi:transcriptional regulator with XRE-family HTH domain